MQNIIEVKNLSKLYGDKTAVDGISFAVKRGSFFAFLGQNGAGKTTTINMIIGLLQKSGGEVLYDGASNLSAFKSKLGVVFQNNISDELLTVSENLSIYASLYLKSRAEITKRTDSLVALLGLEDILRQRFKTLSGGQKRKVEVARALLTSPEILFLDEPTTGLDPKTRAELWAIIRELKDNGMTVFLTTHYMEETSAADNVAIIDKGKIAAVGSPAFLKSCYAFDRLLITPFDCQLLEKQLLTEGKAWKKTADVYTVRIDNTADSINLLSRIRDNIQFYEVIKGSMDDVFLSVVGKQAIDSENLSSGETSLKTKSNSGKNQSGTAEGN